MKKINYSEFGLVEMDSREMSQINGGIAWFLLGAVAGAFVSEVFFDGPKKCWEDLKNGFNSIPTYEK